MLIPLGTDVRLRRPTLITYVLMVLCVVAFVGQQVADSDLGSGDRRDYEALVLYGTPDAEEYKARRLAFEERLAAEEQRPGDPKPRFVVNPPKVWQFITYQFLHGGWLHLIGNMIFLLVFGPPVEDRFGRVGFAAFYLIAGALAGAAHGLNEWVPLAESPFFSVFQITGVIGASGSIAAVSGAYLVMFPKAPVRVLFFFFLIGRFALPGWMFVGISVFYDLLFLSVGSEGVAHIAHLGGYVVGAAVAMFLLWRKIIERQPFDLFSMARQAKRRREFRELVSKGPGASPFLKDAGPKAEAAPEDPHAEERRAIAALAKTDPGGAADRYVALAREDAGCVLVRDAQIAVANALYERGDAQEAASAYEGFIRRFPEDREVDQMRLMLALLCARKLNDPVAALKHLDAVDEESLPEGLRALASTVREELG